MNNKYVPPAVQAWENTVLLAMLTPVDSYNMINHYFSICGPGKGKAGRKSEFQSIRSATQ